MENIAHYIFIYTIIVFFSTLIYAPIHRILRNKKIYIGFLLTSIILSIISFLYWDQQIQRNKKELIFFNTAPVFFFILYKIFDNKILKKYNRHIYFSKKYNAIFGDKESDLATSQDLNYQALILLIPILICFICGKIYNYFYP